MQVERSGQDWKRQEKRASCNNAYYQGRKYEEEDKDKNGDGANDGKNNLVLAQFFLIYKTLKSSAHNPLVLRGKNGRLSNSHFYTEQGHFCIVNFKNFFRQHLTVSFNSYRTFPVTGGSKSQMMSMAT